jgi:hypothetical protein
MSITIIEESTPRRLTVTAGTTSRTIEVTGTVTTSELLSNENLLAALGTGGNLRVVNSINGATIDGALGSDVSEIELVAVGSTKG